MIIVVAHAHQEELAARDDYERAYRRLCALDVELWRSRPANRRLPWSEHTWRLFAARCAWLEKWGVLKRAIDRHTRWYRAHHRARMPLLMHIN